jgi:hypothetical protein
VGRVNSDAGLLSLRSRQRGRRVFSDKLDQHIPGLNPVTLGHLDVGDDARDRRGDVGFHLHGFQNQDGVAGVDAGTRSPVSGVVVKVVAAAGASINAGDSILILEAMKMETNITAPVSGVIADIKVAQGDRVQTGDVLVEFE